MKDEHGVDVILGNPYLYIYGMPGPDTTLVIAKEFKNDKVLCFDVYSERDIELDHGNFPSKKDRMDRERNAQGAKFWRQFSIHAKS